MLNNKLMYLLIIILVLFPLYSPASDLRGEFSLKDVNVVSVSKRSESAFDAASAIYVISQSDIRRSGATNVPELLRMVPGIEVARIDANKWAITARGFNRQYANKLLVMVDGRTVYTPHFSGTYWDAQDTILEDIDRIEVIRGPGAALWGENAVNGVINIITKSSMVTQGKLVTGIYGNEENTNVSTRYGGRTANDVYYRLYGKYFNRDATHTLTGANANNDWQQGRTGFRTDWTKSGDDTVTVSGEVYKGEENQTLTLPAISSSVNGDEDYIGGNLMGKWKKVLSNASKIEMQMYYSHETRNVTNILDRKEDTVDIDLQHDITLNSRNDITWGVGYRIRKDEMTEKKDNGNTYLLYSPLAITNSIYSSFIQDKITLSPEKIFLTLGSKFDHNDDTGYGVQPSAKISWLATENQTLWGSVAKAIRSPSRGERTISLVAANVGSSLVRQVGNDQFDAEKLTAYEIGYRVMPKPNLSFDIATFYNDYQHLRSYEPNGTLLIPLSNNGYGETYGLEISSDWGVTNNWHLVGAYSFLTINLHTKPGSTDIYSYVDEKASPTNQYKLASHLNLPHGIELDNMMYFVSSLNTGNVPSYTRFDTRLGWEAAKGLELSLVGQNLTDERHQEFTQALYTVPNEIGRSIYAKVTYRF